MSVLVQLSDAQVRAVEFARTNKGYVAAGYQDGGRDLGMITISARTIQSLCKLNVMKRAISPDGGVAGRLTKEWETP